MKALKVTRLIFILFISAALSGCIEVNTLITVNNDGSGTVEETVMLSREIIDMITELQSSFAPDTASIEPFQFYKEEELQNNAELYGVEVSYISSEQLSAETKEGYRVKYGFKDINNLKINQNPNSRVKLESFEEEPEVQEEFITFNFIKDKPSEIRIYLPLDKQLEKQENESVDKEKPTDMDTTGMTDQLIKIFQDLKFALAVDVNGKIIQTNAEYVEKNRVTLFEISFAELISNAEKLKEFKETDPQNFEQVKKILRSIPGLKIEPNNQLFIKFE